jgi:hypothetical protein
MTLLSTIQDAADRFVGSLMLSADTVVFVLLAQRTPL